MTDTTTITPHDDWPEDLPTAFVAVLYEIAAENLAAQDRHGFDPDNDDRRSDLDWSWFLLRRITEALTPPSVFDHSPEGRRRLLLEVAHIATSAIASHDRRQMVEDEDRADIVRCRCGAPIVPTGDGDGDTAFYRHLGPVGDVPVDHVAEPDTPEWHEDDPAPIGSSLAQAIGGAAAVPMTSTDGRWRYVTRPEETDVERHVLQCRNWEGGDCRGACSAGYSR